MRFLLSNGICICIRTEIHRRIGVLFFKTKLYGKGGASSEEFKVCKWYR